MAFPDWLHPAVIGGTILYAVIGVIVLWLSFVIIDKPIGDEQSSPVVCKRIPRSSQGIATMPRPSTACCAPYHSAPKPRPS